MITKELPTQEMLHVDTNKEIPKKEVIFSITHSDTTIAFKEVRPWV